METVSKRSEKNMYSLLRDALTHNIFGGKHKEGHSDTAITSAFNYLCFLHFVNKKLFLVIIVTNKQ